MGEPMDKAALSIHLESAAKQGISGKGIGVAVMDTGIFAHPDFNGRLIAFYDAINHRTDFYTNVVCEGGIYQIGAVSDDAQLGWNVGVVCTNGQGSIAGDVDIGILTLFSASAGGEQTG